MVAFLFSLDDIVTLFQVCQNKVTVFPNLLRSGVGGSLVLGGEADGVLAACGRLLLAAAGAGAIFIDKIAVEATSILLTEPP